MRTTVLALCAAAFLCGTLACRKRGHTDPAATVEEEAGPQSSISFAGPNVDSQIIYGFHENEGNSWRWTKKKFAVRLLAPLVAPDDAVWLELEYYVPSAAHSMVGASIAARVGATALEALTIPGPGLHAYRRRVPAAALDGNDAVVVEFSLSRTIPPSASDDRELGLAVSRVGLLAQ